MIVAMVNMTPTLHHYFSILHLFVLYNTSVHVCECVCARARVEEGRVSSAEDNKCIVRIKNLWTR